MYWGGELERDEMRCGKGREREERGRGWGGLKRGGEKKMGWMCFLVPLNSIISTPISTLFN